MEEMALQNVCSSVCVCVSCKKRDGCMSLVALSMAWLDLVLVPPLLSNHRADQRPGTCKPLEIQRGYEGKEEGVSV